MATERHRCPDPECGRVHPKGKGKAVDTVARAKKAAKARWDKRKGDEEPKHERSETE